MNMTLERRVAERTAEAEARAQDLSAALGRVKRLEGLLRICSYCKKIRDDQAHWWQLEEYISSRTDALFTHGICPECYERVMKEL